jgi:sec-independent protein translocase protein TatC
MAEADVAADPARRDLLSPSQPPASDPSPGTAAPEDQKVMSLVDHLSELRTRLFKTILAIAVGSVIGFYFAGDIIRFLVAPLPTGKVQVLGPGDAFFINMKVAVVTGIILAMPVILYQGWAFIAPGLTAGERKIVWPYVLASLVLFVIGVGVAYVVLPFANAFLLSFTSDVLVGNIAAGPYFDFVTTLFLAFGLVMEFPMVLFGLSRVGIVTSARMRAARRYVILGTAIFAAVVTPGGDLVSPIVLGVTMYVLFEITLWVIARTGR